MEDWQCACPCLPACLLVMVGWVGRDGGNCCPFCFPDFPIPLPKCHPGNTCLTTTVMVLMKWEEEEIPVREYTCIYPGDGRVCDCMHYYH